MSVLLLQSIRDREPFVYAKQRFYSGDLLVQQAIVMVASDSDFAYSAIVNGTFQSPRDAAEQVVRKVWCKELCEALAAKKRLPGSDQPGS